MLPRLAETFSLLLSQHWPTPPLRCTSPPCPCAQHKASAVYEHVPHPAHSKIWIREEVEWSCLPLAAALISSWTVSGRSRCYNIIDVLQPSVTSEGMDGKYVEPPTQKGLYIWADKFKRRLMITYMMNCFKYSTYYMFKIVLKQDNYLHKHINIYWPSL